MKLVTSKKQGGFTLVELVMVIVVIAMLSAYLGPKFAGLERQARIAQMNKISGSIAEIIQVSKGISVAELDASVSSNLTDLAVTGINYDGINSTQNSTGSADNAVTLAGEDITTEFHFPKAITSTAPAAAGATGGADIATVDSILFALTAQNSSVSVYRVPDQGEATVANFLADCTAVVDNNGDAELANSFVAYETEADATAAAAAVGTVRTEDTVMIVPCGLVSSQQLPALSGAEATTAISALECFVEYNDASTDVATALDTFTQPNVSTTVSGC